MVDALAGTGRLAIAAALATFATALYVVTPASANTNTFRGACTGIPATATWPGSSIHTLPAPLHMVVTYEGGSCSGILNGRRIDGIPLRDGYLDVTGPMGCIGGVAEGRAGFTLAGRTFAGNAHYRRGGLTPLVAFEGDAGGSATGLARVLVGPDNFQSVTEQCNSEAGLPQVRLLIERVSAELSISSPQA